MLPRTQTILTPPTQASQAPLSPPAWAGDWTTRGIAAMRSVTVPRAVHASAEGFRHLTRTAMNELFADLAGAGFPCVVRMWNFIPQVHATLDNGEDRYMAFNAGRHDAMSARFGPALPAQAPAATGVGHRGEDLHIHALALRSPGTPLNNPLQTPAYKYSKRYGNLPPCFARATQTPHALLISGTAAIRGETTLAENDLAKQLALILENLATLTRNQRLTSARAYIPPHSDRDQIRETCDPHFDHLELVEADLCRKDLLVEIEGIVPLQS